MATAYIDVVQHTKNINADERVIDIHPKIYYDEPDSSPFTILTWGDKGTDGLPINKLECTNPEFKVLEKAPFESYSAINYSTGYVTATTTFIVDASRMLNVGMLIQDTISKEIMYITAVGSATEITVLRSVGVTAAGAIADNTPLKVLGNVSAEYADLPAIKGVKTTTRTNYCQIMRFPFGLSRTLDRSDLYGGSKRADLRKEGWLEWRKRCERAFLHGEPFEDTANIDSDGNPTRGTGGVIYWLNVAGQVTAVATTLTKAIWRTFSRNLFKNGPSMTKVVICSPLVIEALDAFKDNKLQFKPMDEIYNIRAAEWEDGQGHMLIVKDRELDDSPLGTGGYGGLAIGVDPKSLKYRFLRGSDVVLVKDRQSPGKDGYIDEIIGEVGLQITNPTWCHMLEGIEEYSTS